MRIFSQHNCIQPLSNMSSNIFIFIHTFSSVMIRVSMCISGSLNKQTTSVLSDLRFSKSMTSAFCYAFMWDVIDKASVYRSDYHYDCLSIWSYRYWISHYVTIIYCDLLRYHVIYTFLYYENLYFWEKNMHFWKFQRIASNLWRYELIILFSFVNTKASFILIQYIYLFWINGLRRSVMHIIEMQCCHSGD